MRDLGPPRGRAPHTWKVRDREIEIIAEEICQHVPSAILRRTDSPICPMADPSIGWAALRSLCPKVRYVNSIAPYDAVRRRKTTFTPHLNTFAARCDGRTEITVNSTLTNRRHRPDLPGGNKQTSTRPVLIWAVFATCSR